MKSIPQSRLISPVAGKLPSPSGKAPLFRQAEESKRAAEPHFQVSGLIEAGQRHAHGILYGALIGGGGGERH